MNCGGEQIEKCIDDDTPIWELYSFFSRKLDTIFI